MWFSGAHSIAACSVAPTRHSKRSIKQIHTYWPFCASCILYGGTELREAILCLLLLLSPSKAEILLTSHISSENNNIGMQTQRQCTFYLLNSSFSVLLISVSLMVIYLYTNLLLHSHCSSTVIQL